MAGQQAVPSAQALAPYAKPHLGRALLDLATSVVPYFALSVLMYLSQKTVESHIRSIFRKLDIPASRSDNRRVHAVLKFLRR